MPTILSDEEVTQMKEKHQKDFDDLIREGNRLALSWLQRGYDCLTNTKCKNLKESQWYDEFNRSQYYQKYQEFLKLFSISTLPPLDFENFQRHFIFNGLGNAFNSATFALALQGEVQYKHPNLEFDCHNELIEEDIHSLNDGEALRVALNASGGRVNYHHDKEVVADGLRKKEATLPSGLNEGLKTGLSNFFQALFGNVNQFSSEALYHDVTSQHEPNDSDEVEADSLSSDSDTWFDEEAHDCQSYSPFFKEETQQVHQRKPQNVRIALKNESLCLSKASKPPVSSQVVINSSTETKQAEDPAKNEEVVVNQAISTEKKVLEPIKEEKTPISMQVLGGFMMALGATAFALAIILSNLPMLAFCCLIAAAPVLGAVGGMVAVGFFNTKKQTPSKSDPNMEVAVLGAI